LKHFQISYTVTGSEKIPESGRFIFVSNHPLGGLDGLVFIHELSKTLRDIIFPVNDLLTSIKNLTGIFIPINKHGAQAKEAAIMLEKAYASDCQILYFPAGLCSRKKRGVIRDLQWHKSFITKSIEHQRDIVPAFISGRNSNFFLRFGQYQEEPGYKSKH